MRERLRRASIRLRRAWRLVPFADKVNAFVGLGGLVFSAIALVLALSALRMGERQEQMAARQTELAERQGKLAERQAEITELQFKLLEDQVSRDAVVRVLTMSPRADQVSFYLLNETLVTVEATEVELLFSRGGYSVKCQIGGKEWPEQRGRRFGQYSTPRQLPPGSPEYLGSCTLSPGAMAETVAVDWEIVTKNRRLKSTPVTRISLKVNPRPSP